ncbi:hypothetical protein EV426DRAFT_434201 [Tirmania nivea]|nr:hypothetical protein EV426DRAFT_434201 [Tirmania nivea]
MTLQTFLALLGDPLDGANSDTLYEDTFAVLAHRPPPKHLGFIDPTSSSLSVTVNGHEFAINQSPQLLKSQRLGGTTGAVVWSLTPLLASFLTSPTNPLAVHGILTPQATILELGSGVSSIMALSFAVAPPHLRPARIVLSDQEYVLRIARQNVENNLHAAGQWEKVREDARPIFVSYKITGSTRKIPSPSASSPSKLVSVAPLILDLISLDWERDSLHHHPAFSQGSGICHISLVVVADCIYNESLIPPLIETCVDACSTTSTSFNNVHPSRPSNESGTLVLIALELRSPDVLDYFLEQFTRYFKVWRMPDSLVSKELRTGADVEGKTLGSGYAIYCGTLRGDVN